MSAAAPQVSILMLTHNHAPFLADAIASVQAQSLRAWELLIGEDHSSDDTAVIAAKAAAADARIRVFSSPSGALGFHRNFARLLAAALAPMVAFLEGDDWWSEPRKLEFQVSLLEADSTLALCGGRTRIIDQRAGQDASAGCIGPAAGQQRLRLADLIDAYSFHFSSVMIRRSAVELPDWIYQQYCLDRPLYLLAALHGDAGIIDADLSIYRLHAGGAWAPLTPLQKAKRSCSLFHTFCLHFPANLQRRFRRSLSHILWGYLAVALQNKQRRQAFEILALGVKAAPGLRLLEQPRITAGALLRALRPAVASR